MSKKLLFATFAGLAMSLVTVAPSARADLIDDMRKQKAEEEKKEEAERAAKKAAEAKEEADAKAKKEAEDKKDEEERKAKAGKSLKEMMEEARNKPKEAINTKGSMDDILKAKLQGGGGMEEAMKAKREEALKKEREEAEKNSIFTKINNKINQIKDDVKNLGKKKDEPKERTLMDDLKEKRAKEGPSIEEMMKKKMGN